MVYVDDMHLTEMGRFGRMRMCHMIADSTEELLNMAALIGIGARHIQKAGTYKEHFDICVSMRKKALRFVNVREVSMRTLSAMTIYRREVGTLATPEDACYWYLNWREDYAPL